MLSLICCTFFGRMVRLSFWPLSQPEAVHEKVPVARHLRRQARLEELHVAHHHELRVLPAGGLCGIGDRDGQREGAGQVSALFLRRLGVGDVTFPVGLARRR